MSVLNAFVLACSTNLDNLAVGLAFGARPALHFGTESTPEKDTFGFFSPLKRTSAKE
jgi:hypothetical protein